MLAAYRQTTGKMPVPLPMLAAYREARASRPCHSYSVRSFKFFT